MSRWSRRLLCGVGLVVLGTVSVRAESKISPLAGKGLYFRNCSPCHGDDGRGAGPNAALFASKPRNLRDGSLDKYSVDDLVGRIREGRELSLAMDLNGLRQQSADVGAIEHHIRRLPTVDWISVENGRAIYSERCSECHGSFGHPEGELPAGVRPPRDLSSEAFQKSVDDEALTAAVQHGRKGMPALVPRLRGSSSEHVAAFVRLLSPGFENYSKFCGHCHGDDGIGVGNFDQSVDAPVVIFDKSYMAHVDPIRLRESVWHMLRQQKPSMPHFRAQVSRAEARAIIEYLRSLPAQ